MLNDELERLVSASEALHAEVVRLREKLTRGARRRAAATERDIARIEEQLVYLRLMLDTVRRASHALRTGSAGSSTSRRAA